MANESSSNRPNRPMRPRQGGAGSRRKRRVVIDNAAARPRDARQQQREREAARPKTPREVVAPTGPITVPSGVTVRDLSQALIQHAPPPSAPPKASGCRLATADRPPDEWDAQ